MLPMFEITLCRVVEKYTTHISLKKHLISFQKVFHANKSAELYIYIVGSITYMYMEEPDISVNLIALFHISNGLATFFIFR